MSWYSLTDTIIGFKIMQCAILAPKRTKNYLSHQPMEKISFLFCRCYDKLLFDFDILILSYSDSS